MSMRANGDLDSDEQLWDRVRAGDGDAFGVVFDRHVDAVYTHCVRRSGSWTEAQDLTSMVFFEAWRKSGRVRFVNGSARPWLIVVATNMARTQARARRRYEAMLTRLPPDRSAADAAEIALGDLEAVRLAAELGEAMSRLGKRDQEVIGLCDWAELSYADAAATLGVPVGTVRSRLSRARRKLRAALNPSGGPDVLDEATSLTPTYLQGGVQ